LIIPSGFFRGCKSPTVNTNGFTILNFSLTYANALSREIGRNEFDTAAGTTITLSSDRLYARSIARREKSLSVRMRDALLMVWLTVKRNCSEREVVKNSGCSK